MSCVLASDISLPVVAKQPNINHQNAFEINVNGWEWRNKVEIKSNTHCGRVWVSASSRRVIFVFTFRYSAIHLTHSNGAAHVECTVSPSRSHNREYYIFGFRWTQVTSERAVADRHLVDVLCCVGCDKKNNISARTRHSIGDCPRHRPVHMNSIISLSSLCCSDFLAVGHIHRTPFTIPCEYSNRSRQNLLYCFFCCFSFEFDDLRWCVACYGVAYNTIPTFSLIFLNLRKSFRNISSVSVWVWVCLFCYFILFFFHSVFPAPPLFAFRTRKTSWWGQ